MTRVSALLRLAGVAACALALSGCISLLPKTKPSHLYRFGQPAGSQAMTAAPGQVGVFRTNATFQRESAGDGILTITNGQAAYISETRWVAPAAILWDEAVLATFGRRGRCGWSAASRPRLPMCCAWTCATRARYDPGQAAHRSSPRPRGPTRGVDRSRADAFEKQVTASDNRVAPSSA